MKKSNPIKWYEVLEKLVLETALPTRTILHGPPGTGKTRIGMELFGRDNCNSCTLNQGSMKEDILGQFVLKKGETIWQDGPASDAIRNGRCLILNEIGEHSPEVETVLHNVLDDPSILELTLPNGEKIRAKDGFRVIATTNTNPIESLGEALFDRFDLMLFAGCPVPGIIEQLPQEQRGLLVNHYVQFTSPIENVKVSARKLMAFNKIVSALGHELAASIIFGKQGGVELLSAISTNKD